VSLGTIYIDGKPIAQARVKLGERRKAPDFAITPSLGTYSFTARCEGTGSIDVFAAIRPVESPVVDMTVPWGILGSIRIRGWVDDSTFSQNEKGTIATLGMVADKQALSRAVSMAAQGAIRRTRRRIETIERALAKPELRSFARSVLTKRGERKQRRAMRRLLRAAGITRREI
jgi:hypothetical protein